MVELTGVAREFEVFESRVARRVDVCEYGECGFGFCG